MPIPQFKIGDVVFHQTGEKGEIVRILDKNRYVVKIELSPPFEGAKEVLWNAKDILREPPYPSPPG
jgi:hypothetical protein